MSARFTPGPWLTTGTTVYALHFARGHVRNKWDCTLYGGAGCPRDELQANAHLIGAAPELYEALTAMWADYIAVCSTKGWEPTALVEHDMVLAALAKARGEK